MGPAHNVRQGLACYILNHNAEVVVRSTISSINEQDMIPSDLETRQDEFSKRVESIIGNYQYATIQRTDTKPNDKVDIYSDLFNLIDGDDDELQVQEFDTSGNPISKPEAEEIIIQDAPNVEINDEWINTILPVPLGGEMI